MCRIISFVSAKGGVGKTTVVYNVSKCIAGLGYKVCVIDAHFCMNEISLMLEREQGVDLKNYLTGKFGTSHVLNKYSQNLFYVKTNSVTFDYLKHLNLIKFFVSEISEEFDYILIDVNSFSNKILHAMLECSTEVMIVCSDDEIDVRNTGKLLSRIKMFSNINEYNLIINKARVIHSMASKSLNEKDIFEILKIKILFVIPKFYKNNFFRNKKERIIKRKFIEKLSYSIITNIREKFDYQKSYRGVVGFIKRLRYLKYE